MLNKILAICFLSFHISTSSFAQTTDTTESDIGNAITQMFSTKISVSVDKNVFPTRSGNMYLSESPTGMLIMMAMPVSFEKSKEQMEKESQKEGVKITDKGQFQAKGKTILFQKGTMKKDGKKFGLEIYCSEGDENRTIYIMAMYEPTEKKRFEDAIYEAVVTAKLAPVEEKD